MAITEVWAFLNKKKNVVYDDAIVDWKCTLLPKTLWLIKKGMDEYSLLAKYDKKTVVLKSTNIMTTKFRFG